VRRSRRLRHDVGGPLDRDVRGRSLELVRARSQARFWRGDEADGEDKRSAYLTLHESLVTIAKLLAPFAPFVADEIYENSTRPGVRPPLRLPVPDDGLVDRELEFGMAVARRTVELGRGGRSQRRSRSPAAARAVVVADPRERAAIERLEDQVLDELNVKGVSYVDEAEELASYEVKPNFRTCGPRFGSRMPEVARAIAELDAAATAAALDRGEEITIEVRGSEERLGPDHLSLVMLPRDGYQLERQANFAVALRLDLDEELRRGAARGSHAIQNVEGRRLRSKTGSTWSERRRRAADTVRRTRLRRGRDACRQPRVRRRPARRHAHRDRQHDRSRQIALRRAHKGSRSAASSTPPRIRALG
jgi:hypothetical protein